MPRTSAVPPLVDTDVVTDVISTVAPVPFVIVPLDSIAQRSWPCDVAVNDAVHATSPVGHGAGAVVVVVVVVGAAVVVVAPRVVEVVRPAAVVEVDRSVVVVEDASSSASSTAVVVEVAASASAVVVVRSRTDEVGERSASTVVVVVEGPAVTIPAGLPGVPAVVPAATRSSAATRRGSRTRPNAIMTGMTVPPTGHP